MIVTTWKSGESISFRRSFSRADKCVTWNCSCEVRGRMIECVLESRTATYIEAGGTGAATSFALSFRQHPIYIFFFFYCLICHPGDGTLLLNPRAISFKNIYVHSMSVGIPLYIISTIHDRLQSFTNLGKSGTMNHRWYDFYMNGCVRERWKKN